MEPLLQKVKYNPLITSPVVIRSVTRNEDGTCDAVWDTGCSMSAITPCVAESLGMSLRGPYIASQMESDYIYYIGRCIIQLHNGYEYKLDVQVVDMKHTDCVIGLDIINQGEFKITPCDDGAIMIFTDSHQ